jgi:pimeloyl-ACP methyl ester carboxylesterase
MHNNEQHLDKRYTDQELIKNWQGFENKYETVNGITLHYVQGGEGTPLLLLPGWPQTWYSFHTIAPELAKTYQVIVIDIRGMGTSSKPSAGYEKKTMAKDIYELIVKLGFEKAHVLGHDIGGMVAMSLAYNHPEVVAQLIIMDGIHPNEGMMQMPLLPPLGTFHDKMSSQMPYAWWMGFNQVKGLPEQLLEDRFRYLVDYIFDYVMIDQTKMTELERAIYAEAYNDREAIRASNAWYQSFAQDIEDSKSYQPISSPVLGIGSNVSYGFMKMGLPYAASQCEVLGLTDSGHYMNEEKPADVIQMILNFLR